jgi:arylamine N-acetyltransferase
LRARLAGLSPSVNPEEARRVAYIAYTTGLELARKWEMVSSPTMQSFLINIGMKKGGYCYQFATELLLRLDAQKFKTLEFHWAESDAGTDTEHNVIAVTARGQPFEQGIMLDNWRRSGRLLWGPLSGDPDHTWQENKAAYASRIIRKPVRADHAKRETNPKKKTHHRAKTRPKGNHP